MILKLDFSSDEPIYLQIRNQIVMGIASGELKAGEKLPTIRALADETGINVMTVNKAYALLKQEGYISAGRRSGAVINGMPENPGPDEKQLYAFKLAISQLKLSGLDRDEISALCLKYFDEGEDNK